MAAFGYIGGVMKGFNPNSSRLLAQFRRGHNLYQRRNATTKLGQNTDIVPGDWGLLFDIDGVIVRGRTILPSAREAFDLLTDEQGKFRVPTVFVTNAGNCLRQTKAKQLSDILGVQVSEDQVVMSHSPLRLLRQFHDKHVLVSGQGPIREMARYLGFRRVTTIDSLRQSFPNLDVVDHLRRKAAPCAFEKYFPRIESIILFGEPVRWETPAQLIVDALVTNGHPSKAPDVIPYPHIPVLACNMDLMWMAEACMPRFGHGCFLHCLESLYQKITGYELHYTALVGKPSEITYHHSEIMIQDQARSMGLPGVRRIYCIGDNPDVDIYGANLYNRYLQRRMERRATNLPWRARSSSGQFHTTVCIIEEEDEKIEAVEGPDQLFLGAEVCESILVCTGVYSRAREQSAHQKRQLLLDHNHRDFSLDPELKKPDMTVHNVYEAVQAIFQKENDIR